MAAFGVTVVDALTPAIQRALGDERRSMIAGAVAETAGSLAASAQRNVSESTSTKRPETYAVPVQVSELEWRVEAQRGLIAFFVENGTGPHVIEAKTAKALRFEIDGEVIFAKRVNHPGTAPTFYFRRAVEEEQPRFLDRVAKALTGGGTGFDSGRFRSGETGRFVAPASIG